LDKTCTQITNDITASKTEEAEVDDESDEESLHLLTKTFEEDTTQAINKITCGNKSTMRTYYTRPSPPDLQYEERGTFFNEPF